MRKEKKLTYLNYQNKELLKVRRNILNDTKKFRDEVRQLIRNNTYEIISDIKAYMFAVDDYLYRIKPRIFLSQIRESDPTILNMSDYYERNYPKSFSKSYRLISNKSGKDIRKRLYPRLKLVKLKRSSLLAKKDAEPEDAKFNFDEDMQLLLETDIKRLRYYYAIQLVRKYRLTRKNIEAEVLDNMETDIRRVTKLKLKESSKGPNLREKILKEYEVFKTDFLTKFVNDIKEIHN